MSTRNRAPPAGVENEHPNKSSQRSNSKNLFANKTPNNYTSDPDRKRQHKKRAFVKNNNRVPVAGGKRHKKHHGTKMRPMSCLVEALPDLSPAEKEDTLSKIESEFDRNLQLVLFEVDCNYVLLEHQFTGVRALTYDGVIVILYFLTTDASRTRWSY